MNIVIAIIIFGILIITHELGHFLMARAVGVGVVEFSVGFGPKIISREHNGTMYSLRVVPFGGYCAMIGENEDSDADDALSNKSPLQRMLVLLGGPMFNFITALILCALIVCFGGADVPKAVLVDEKYGAYAAGIRDGDIIRSIDGSSIGLGKDIDLSLVLKDLTDGEVTVEYERDGEISTAVIDPAYKTWLIGISYSATDEAATISAVNPDYPAAEAGLEVGDVIVAVNGNPVSSGSEMRTFMEGLTLDGTPISLTYSRNGVEKEVTVEPRPYTGYYIGFESGYTHEKVGFFGVIKNTFLEFGYWIRYVFTSLRMILTGKVGLSDMSGPVGIVAIIGSTVEQSMSDGILYVILNLMTIAALLASNLGVFNLLPLPALDGGQLMIALIELVSRRKIPEQGKGIINTIGLTFWMAVMGLILFSDVWKMIR
ncbi:MAG: RIP metalloprotease RseP [Lachnospiraceae bacterium]|nr:RIP metalloprotease RseP [Lachnospiraceae bacterium]